jgi:hypothetical protein
VWKAEPHEEAYAMNIIDKARIAVEIKAFHNTDFSDCLPLNEEQLKEFKPSHLRNMANYNPTEGSVK